MTLLSYAIKRMVPLSLLFLSGCATGAMRIDVDVYKGPLVQTPDVQFGSLIGYLEETKRSLVENMNATLVIVAHEGFEKLNGKAADCSSTNFREVAVKDFLRGKQNENEELVLTNQGSTGAAESKTRCTHEKIGSMNDKKGLYLYFPYFGKDTWKSPTIEDSITWCDKLDAEGWYDLMIFSDCMILRAVFSDSKDMLKEVHDLLQGHIKEVHQQDWDINEWRTRSLLIQVAKIGSRFREKAFRWAKGNVAGQSPNCFTRIALMNFVLSASESGNQLQARADTLLKQLSLRDGRDARELALSTYLQDTEPTDFVHLYDWMEASADGCPLDWVRRHVYPLGYPSIDVQNRVKILERLYGDYYWSRINTVHASGVGTVNMVFVKDGIGNWNLKNFENYPGELLEAYLNVGKKALESAAKMAAATSGFGSGGVAIEAALKFASQAIADPPSAMSGTQLLEDLAANEADLRSRIAAEAQLAKEEEEKIRGDPKQLKAARKTMIERFEKIMAEFDSNMDVLKKTSQAETDPKDNPEAEKLIRKTLKSPFTWP